MNSKISCIIVDDEPMARDIIADHLAKIDRIEIIAMCNNALEAFNKINSQKIDLIFLDIHMPEISGISFAKSINKEIKIIFTTAYREYAIDGFDLHAVDYLLKPISFVRFLKAVNKYRTLMNTAVTVVDVNEDVVVNDHMYVNSNKKFIKINFKDILYVESIKDYVRIHLKDTTVITKDSITNFELKLPQDFLRIHRSFIVNTSKVSAFTKVDIEIGDKEIPIGASYKDNVIGFLKG